MNSELENNKTKYQIYENNKNDHIGWKKLVEPFEFLSAAKEFMNMMLEINKDKPDIEYKIISIRPKVMKETETENEPWDEEDFLEEFDSEYQD